MGKDRQINRWTNRAAEAEWGEYFSNKFTAFMMKIVNSIWNNSALKIRPKCRYVEQGREEIETET